MSQYMLAGKSKIKNADYSSRTAFIDECGSFGFDFSTEGNSKYYIICAVCIKDAKISELENSIEQIRKNNFGNSKEMKSSTVGNDYKRRNKIVSDLLPIEFRVIVLIADKQAFVEGSPLTLYKKSFIKFLHQRLYDVLYHVYPVLKIVEDATGTSEFQAGFKKYVEDHRPEISFFNDYDFTYTDSRNSVLIQLADMIGGTISKYYSDANAPNYMEMLSGKIIRIEEFPSRIEPYFAASIPEDAKFDKDIFNLSVKCANDFITKHSDADDFENQMQVAFLRYLLFQVHNVNALQFVSSSKIVSVLSEYAGKRIRRDFLFRRIVAQLREAGVIISSCTQGYKIPVCMNDIISYLNQTSSLVSPMLHRVDICRKLILQQTDRKLDILENDVFAKYKTYFDG